ncbi:MAG: hypothetical protein PHZ11_04730 [Desulfitobacteriaceae bacterium]|nr:hypothetical protein [Desulfitobacteriaceae bacterium]MDD4346193.1 hypothetical protein [Desulfitobacteriaceae bacterium]MDD4401168.1 hypothetical protein [Desulfitobacteriaceae bacterium]
MTLSSDTEVLNTDHEEGAVCCSETDNCCCTKSQDITFEVCEDVKDFTIQDVQLNCVGRFLKVRVELDNACPGRKVAVGVFLCENIQGTFFTKGFKVREVMIPGSGSCKQNVPVGEFCFVLPEESLCSRRTVRVNIVAHYSSFPSFPFCPC